MKRYGAHRVVEKRIDYWNWLRFGEARGGRGGKREEKDLQSISQVGRARQQLCGIKQSDVAVVCFIRGIVSLFGRGARERPSGGPADLSGHVGNAAGATGGASDPVHAHCICYMLVLDGPLGISIVSARTRLLRYHLLSRIINAPRRTIVLFCYSSSPPTPP